MTDPRRVLPGRKPGDRRVRVERPQARYFRYQAPGVLSAKLAVEEPATPLGAALARTRRVLFGRPLSTEEEILERLPKWKALPVFSSDVMSSVAYATEASLYTLLGVGTLAFAWLLPISVAIVGVLALVTLSYRQTIRAYPNGGGSYIVAHANLGVLPGLVAAAALLTDYVLTVAVSVSSGVQALYSLFPPLLPLAVPIIVVSILLVMTVNLRGIRESGTIFAAPTYIFLGSALFMIGLGVLRTLLGQAPHVTGVVPAHVPAETFGLLLLMRAFADGCSAMTGTEAVANGVPAFEPPEWRNARTTMLAMSLLLGTMFLGTSLLAHVSGALPSASGESVLSQIGRSVYGAGPLWYVLQLSTMGILILAAQTSFADFPRVASILAKDGYFPRQFAFRGERLAFNAGIMALAAVSIALVIAFRGQVEALIPLYAIGVFTAFTLSQAGMVRHWFREGGSGWRRSAFFNGLGATTTAIVVVIFAIAKFALGAWIILVVVPILVALMLFVHHEYSAEGAGLEVSRREVIPPPHRPQRVVVVAPAFNRAVVQAIRVGQTMTRDVDVVHVTADLDEGERFRERVEQQVPSCKVVIVESPYRSLVKPFVRFLETSQAEKPNEVAVVLIPEYVPLHWWDRILYNQNSHLIRAALVGRRDIVVLDVPYRRAEPAETGDGE
ncbi:MAG TPA: APC family permease [Candidatus Acidoferrales bacterium]|nr:APC family permease [Candidatus Acidoferrales bacterium]